MYSRNLSAESVPPTKKLLRNLLTVNYTISTISLSLDFHPQILNSKSTVTMIISLRRVRLLRTDLCFWPNDHPDGEVADNNRSLHRNLEKVESGKKDLFCSEHICSL